MMQKHRYNDKINSLKLMKKAASPDEQLEIDFTIFGMKWAFGEDKDDKLHIERMKLYYGDSISDMRKGKAYRTGINTVLYNKRGEKKEKGTKMIPALRVDADIERGLNNLQKFYGFNTLSPVRKAALRWYIEMMSEKHGRDFLNE